MQPLVLGYTYRLEGVQWDVIAASRAALDNATRPEMGSHYGGGYTWARRTTQATFYSRNSEGAKLRWGIIMHARSKNIMLQFF